MVGRDIGKKYDYFRIIRRFLEEVWVGLLGNLNNFLVLGLGVNKIIFWFF